MYVKTLIPESFMIFAQKIQVVTQPDLAYHADDRGQFRPRYGQIVLQPQNEASPIPTTRVEQTFCHEVIHAWFEALGETELYKNEGLADRLGHCLHQFLVTAEPRQEKYDINTILKM